MSSNKIDNNMILCVFSVSLMIAVKDNKQKDVVDSLKFRESNTMFNYKYMINILKRMMALILLSRNRIFVSEISFSLYTYIHKHIYYIFDIQIQLIKRSE